MPAVANVVVCRRGYHLVTKLAVLDWLHCPAVVYEAEGRGCSDADDDKTAFEQARLIRRVGRLTKETLITWAADFAERVLPIFERRFPNDARPREAIKVARAAAAAAYAAADDAAARAADAARDAVNAAYASARAADAAYAAADDAAAYAAARAAYASARAAVAARDAAYDADVAYAAYTAADAAVNAASCTVPYAVRAATYVALNKAKKRRWQADHLFRLMKAEA
jgi:hypothetical protein